MQCPQIEDLLQDLDLKELDHFCCHFWALIKTLNSAGIVVNGQQFINFDEDLFWCIAFKHGHANFVENRVLHALLGRRPEERVVLQHVEHQLDQAWRASLEQFLHIYVHAAGLV